MTSVFITILKGYAEKIINANFKVLSFNKDHTVSYRPHYHSKKQVGLLQLSIVMQGEKHEFNFRERNWKKPFYSFVTQMI